MLLHHWFKILLSCKVHYTDLFIIIIIIYLFNMLLTSGLINYFSLYHKLFSYYVDITLPMCAPLIQLLFIIILWYYEPAHVSTLIITYRFLNKGFFMFLGLSIILKYCNLCIILLYMHEYSVFVYVPTGILGLCLFTNVLNSVFL